MYNILQLSKKLGKKCQNYLGTPFFSVDKPDCRWEFTEDSEKRLVATKTLKNFLVNRYLGECVEVDLPDRLDDASALIQTS